MTAQPVEEEPILMTEAEYLAFEEQADDKHEFVDGYAYPLHGLAGATIRHNRLSTRVFQALAPAATRGGCEAFLVDIRVRFRRNDRVRYYYPDALVACGELDPNSLWVEQPLVVVEVTSNRTARFDRREKLETYQSLPSVRAYLIVSHSEPRIDAYVRDSELRGFEHTVSTSGTLWLACLDATLELDEVFR